ncbi:MAG: hypothetical protein ACYDD6_08795, partial [Acidimicrobiales bacterium]
SSSTRGMALTADYLTPSSGNLLHWIVRFPAGGHVPEEVADEPRAQRHPPPGARRAGQGGRWGLASHLVGRHLERHGGSAAGQRPVDLLAFALHHLVERTGMKIDDFDAIECNEAFAAIALMWSRAFSPDPDRFNPRGGAIAIGHPLGASGVRLMTTLLNQLEATGGRYGFQTMCEGGGQANATVIERLA